MQYVILDHPQELSPAMVEGIFKLSPAQVGENIQQFYCGQACHLNLNWLPKQPRPAQQSWCGELGSEYLWNPETPCEEPPREFIVDDDDGQASQGSSAAGPPDRLEAKVLRPSWGARPPSPQDRHRLNWWLSTGRSSNARTDRYHSEEQWLWTRTHGQ